MSPRSGIRIRAAALGDAGSIARVHARSWEEAYSSFLPAEVIAARGAPRRLEQWAGMLAAPPPRHAVLVGELDGEVVGFASVGPAEDAQDAVDGSGELHALYVSPEHWRRGVGAALLADAEEQLRELDFRRARLRVLAANETARRVYERAGWVASGPDEDFEGAPTLCYRKQLV